LIASFDQQEDFPISFLMLKVLPEEMEKFTQLSFLNVSTQNQQLQ